MGQRVPDLTWQERQGAYYVLNPSEYRLVKKILSNSELDQLFEWGYVEIVTTRPVGRTAFGQRRATKTVSVPFSSDDAFVYKIMIGDYQREINFFDCVKEAFVNDPGVWHDRMERNFSVAGRSIELVVQQRPPEDTREVRVHMRVFMEHSLVHEVKGGERTQSWCIQPIIPSSTYEDIFIARYLLLKSNPKRFWEIALPA